MTAETDRALVAPLKVALPCRCGHSCCFSEAAPGARACECEACREEAEEDPKRKPQCACRRYRPVTAEAST